MYFERFFDERLAQASYLIGCQGTGTAIVIDPARRVAPYLTAAAARELSIVAVTETHIHADFVSGLRELQAATGATAYLSGAGPAEWQYRFRGDPRTVTVVDRDRITIGKVIIEAVHTPGHTPEHLSFLVTDGAVAPEPMGIVTGDFVFVGDVGRPDLLEKAAHLADTARAGAAQLFRSLEWFKTLPDHLQVWPGHGAGSACGKGLGAMPQSTVGYERRFNWAFGAKTEEEFVRQVLEGQPDPPRYFGRMKQVNRDGPAVLGTPPAPALLPPARIGPLREQGAIVVDTRSTAEFAAGHLVGTLNIPLSRNFPTYAGSLLPPDQELFFILPVASPAATADLVEALLSIGLERIGGVFDRAAWAGATLGTMPQTTPAELKQRGGAVTVIDVRNRSEWEAGHLPHATLIPLPELVDRLAEIPREGPVVVHCQGGGRSSIAASLLEARGYGQVSNLAGGFSAWAAAGGSVEK